MISRRTGNAGDIVQVDGPVQDCSAAIADALELLKSCINPSTCFF